MSKIKKLVIPREKWGKAFMLREVGGKMCCLGHLAAACGADPDSLLCVSTPSGVVNLPTKYPAKLNNKPSRYNFGRAKLAMEINDSFEISGPEKERRLKILFGSVGIKLSFTGKGRP